MRLWSDATYLVVTLTLDLEWDVPLKRRQGGATHLDGIALYYEFEWRAVFPDERAQFKNGQCLAKFVRDSCPDDKTPALLLMDRDHVEEGARETDLHFVFVLNLPRYLRANADAALSYLASHLGSGVTRLSRLNELAAAARPEVIRAVVGSQLNLEHIAEWASGNPERLEQLRGIAGAGDATRAEASLSETIAALEALGGIDAEGVAVIARLFGPGTERERRLELVRAVTDDPTGRYITGEVLAERTPQRVADARNAMAAYQACLTTRPRTRPACSSSSRGTCGSSASTTPRCGPGSRSCGG